ncbi:MAG: tRNA-dihydrouridine synthase family protein, partial [Gemmatimonadetes bacterium]|nr:tRNA-dihydrouridine synthase family protein [Gemmatimonadota bacterium]
MSGSRWSRFGAIGPGRPTPDLFYGFTPFHSFFAMAPNFLEMLGGVNTPLYLAPQAGVSESPFRRLCRRFGADVLVSEFVSAAGIVMNSKRSRDYLRFDEAERPIGIQIFGADRAMMGDAAAFVAEVYGPDFIDINFGCPV